MDDHGAGLASSSGSERVAEVQRLPRVPRGIVFDLDGTLLDTEGVYRAAFMVAAAAIGWTVPAKIYDGLIGLPSTARRRLLPDLLGDTFPAVEFFEAYYRCRSLLMGETVALKPGVHLLLDTLAKAGMASAIATSASARTAARHLAMAGLSGRFAAVVSRDDVGRGKPAPDSFTLAVELLGLAPEDCLAVEDSRHGVQAAHAAGLMVVMVPDAVPPCIDSRGWCDAIVGSLDEVAVLLTAGLMKPPCANDRSRLRV